MRIEPYNYSKNTSFGMSIKMDPLTKFKLENSLSKRAYQKLQALIEKEKYNTADIVISTKKYSKNDRPYFCQHKDNSWDFLIKTGDKEILDDNVFISTLGQIKRALKYAKKYEKSKYDY